MKHARIRFLSYSWVYMACCLGLLCSSPAPAQSAGPDGDGKVDVSITDGSPAAENPVYVLPGQALDLHINVDKDAQDVRAGVFIVDLTQKSPGAQALSFALLNKEIVVNPGSIFSFDGAQYNNAVATSAGPGRALISLAYGNPTKPGNGPGSLVVVPIRVHAKATLGSTYLIRLLRGTGESGMELYQTPGPGDRPSPLTFGTVGTLTLIVGYKPPAGGLPGPDGDGKVDMNVTDDAPGALQGIIPVSPGDEVFLRVNVDADAQDIQGAEMVLDFTQKTVGAPDITGKATVQGVEASLGDIFSPTDAVLATALGTQIAAGKIKVAVAYLNNTQAAKGAGSVAVVPIVVPKDAPEGAQWFVFLTGDTDSRPVLSDGTKRLPTGTLGHAVLEVHAIVPMDVDSNGIVNILDVVKALRIAAGLEAGTERQIRSGDLDLNGKVEITDVLAILRKVARRPE